MSRSSSISSPNHACYANAIAHEQRYQHSNSTVLCRFLDVPVDTKKVTFRELRWSELVSFALVSKAALACFNQYMQHIQAVLSTKLNYPPDHPFEAKKAMVVISKRSAVIKHLIGKAHEQITQAYFLALLAMLAKPFSERRIKDLAEVALLSQERGNALVNLPLHAQHLLRDEVLIELARFDLTEEQWQNFLAIPGEHIAGGLVRALEEDLEDSKGLMLESRLFANIPSFNFDNQAATNNYQPISLPLHWSACKADRIDKFKELISHGADVHLPNHKNENLWHIVLKNRNPRLAELLFDEQVAITQQDDVGLMPYHWAARYGYFEFFQKLTFGSGIDLHKQLETDRRILSFAVLGGNINLIKWLLEHGAQKHINSVTQRAPLHHAVSSGQTNTARLLLESGAKPDIQDEKLQSPLSMAVNKGSLAMVELLLKYQATPTSADLAVAEKKKYFEILGCLSDAMKANTPKQKSFLQGLIEHLKFT